MAEALEWQGLTKLITDLQETIPQKATDEIRQMTEDLFDLTLTFYVNNLSGGEPSTDATPLPVGMRSGDLIGHAEDDSQMVNQYSFEIRNESEHAGLIEDGTAFFEPRKPLANAVDMLETIIGGKMDDTMKTIIGD